MPWSRKEELFLLWKCNSSSTQGRSCRGSLSTEYFTRQVVLWLTFIRTESSTGKTQSFLRFLMSRYWTTTVPSSCLISGKDIQAFTIHFMLHSLLTLCRVYLMLHSLLTLSIHYFMSHSLLTLSIHYFTSHSLLTLSIHYFTSHSPVTIFLPRDVKPSNILIWSLDIAVTPNIKLSDYGIAGVVSSAGVKGMQG